MAVLINGNGNEAIYAAQDADWYASIFGGTTAITGVGNQFAAEVLDANTIGVSDGVIITKEGRRIQLDVDEIDNFDIPNGGQGETNYYIIGYRLVTGGDSSQTAEEFVELMYSSTATINEETFREGADSVYISLYRIKQEGFTLTIQDALLPTVKSVMQLNEDLSELTTSNETLLATITSFNTTTDVVIDMSGYNEILFDIITNQQASGYPMHSMYRYKPSDIEKVRADTAHTFGTIAPVLNMVGQFSTNAYTQLRLYCMSSANTYRFDSGSNNYTIESVKVYGCK